MNKGEKNIMMKTARWLSKNLKQHRFRIFIIIFLNIVWSFLLVANSVIMKEFLDSALIKSREKFIQYACCLAGVLLLQLAISFVQRYLDERVKADTENTLTLQAYKALLRADYIEFSKHHTGEYINRMISDVVIIADGITGILPTMVGMLANLIFASIVLTMMEPKFSVMFLTGGAVVIALSWLFRKKMKALHILVREKNGEVQSFLQETLQNILVLRAFSAQNKAAVMCDGKLKEYKNARLKRVRFGNICNVGFGSVMDGAYLIGLVWCGLEIINGRITYGTLAAVLNLIGIILSPVAQFTGLMPKLFGMFASADRMIEMEQMEAEQINIESSKEKIQDIYQKMSCIQLDKVTFAYPGIEDLILEEADLVIRKGEHVAITGRSGTGKSTMFKLLLALCNKYSGEITLLTEDDTYDVTPSIRGIFTYVPQGNLLLSGSILDAIDLFHEEGKVYTKQEQKRIQEVCEIACASNFIEALPNGYETKLGEKGTGLSEGQIQRLAIARALYTDAPIILLDEATSALDLETEVQVLQNLKQLTNKTVLIVTHRKAALEVCNKIIELRDRKFYVLKE